MFIVLACSTLICSFQCNAIGSHNMSPCHGRSNFGPSEGQGVGIGVCSV